MSSKPFFSIVTRIRNMSDLFDDMFMSLQSQTCQDFELWVLDHHSEDDIKEKIELLQKKHDNIYYKKIDIFSDFYKSVEYINGEVFFFLDADDMLTLNCLKKMKETFQKYDIDFLTTNFAYFDNNYNLIDEENIDYIGENEYISRIESPIRNKNISFKKTTGNEIIEKYFDYLNKYPLFDDSIFLYIMEAMNFKNTHLKDILCYYRKGHEQSLTSNSANLYENYDKETKTEKYNWGDFYKIKKMIEPIIKEYDYKYSNYIKIIDNHIGSTYKNEFYEIIKDKTHIEIQKIENTTIHFSYKKDGAFIFKLYSGDNFGKLEYEDKIDINKNVFYWISHPSLLIQENIKFSIFDLTNNIIEEKILYKKDLVKQKNHIISKIGEKVYNDVKKYINPTYFEFFGEKPQYGLKDIKLKKEYINVVDIGSNIGCFGLFLSDFFKLENYICVEPNEELNYVNKIFNKEAINHKIINLIFYKDNDSVVNFCVPEEKINSAISTIMEDFRDKFDKYPDNKIISKKTINFKKIIEDSKLNFVDILKIDIEGAEIYLLEDEKNIEIIKNKVEYLIVEVHSKEVKDKFLDIFIKNGFSVEVKDILTEEICTLQIKNNNLFKIKNILLSINCVALGDTICSTPTVRRVSESYNQKINIMTHRPDVFINNSYVDKIYSFNEEIDKNNFDEIFETYNTHISTNCFNKSIDMEIKLSNFEARQLHALGVGMTLYPNEMEYDYIPEEEKEETKKINKDFLIFHITESWANRTWTNNKWQRLVDLVKQNTNFKIATIGRHHKEITYNGEIDKKIISLDNIDINFCCEEEGNGKYQNESNYNNTISDMWHIINNGCALISFDSGPIHLAGTTDTNIIQIGSSIRYEKTAPYRQGRQNYKFYFVGGECKKFCGSDIKYSVKEWGTINSMPYYPECQEEYNEFYCHPTPEQVFFKICEIKE